MRLLEEVDELSKPLGEVWIDGLPAYLGMVYDHQYVVRDEGYVSEKGVHTDHVEYRWSLLQPWEAKFRGLSKQGLEQAAHTYGCLRSLDHTGSPIHALVDCIAVNMFR